MRAQALHSIGRYEEALRLYTYALEARYLAAPLLAPSHLYRGEIYEAREMPDSAAWHYSAFVELWKDADPESQPLVDEVRERIARLEAR